MMAGGTTEDRFTEYAYDATQHSGTYKLTTFAAGDGAVPGEYKVAVTKLERTAASAGAAGSAGGLASGDLAADYEAPKEVEGAAEPSTPKSQLPAKYANAETSGLTATVSEGPNNIDFDLTR